MTASREPSGEGRMETLAATERSDRAPEAWLSGGGPVAQSVPWLLRRML